MLMRVVRGELGFLHSWNDCRSSAQCLEESEWPRETFILGENPALFDAYWGRYGWRRSWGMDDSGRTLSVDSRLWFPLWWLVGLSLAYPFVAFIRGPLRRYRRRRRGLCLKCGYDLTGNVSGVCPECGAEVARPSVPGRS